MGRSAAAARGLGWLARGAGAAPLPAWIALGFLALILLGSLGWRPDPPQPFDFAAFRRLPSPPSARLIPAAVVTPEPAAPVAAKPPMPTRPRLARADRWLQWRADEDGDPQTYRIGEVSLTFGAMEQTTDSYGVHKSGTAVLVQAPGMTPYRLSIEGSMGSANFGVGRLDRSRPGPQVLLGVFTGGAHCCTRYVLLTPKGKTWTPLEIGEVDKAMDDWPVDRNGDGSPDMLIGDDNFNYAFAPYAGSWAPYVFWQIEDGRVVDVSDDRRLARFHRRYMNDALVYCRQRQNGACAGFVAAAARAGRFDWAWQVMLENHDPGNPWSLPPGCQAAPVDGQCPGGREIVYRTYPEALRGFLQDLGYIPR